MIAIECTCVVRDAGSAQAARATVERPSGYRRATVGRPSATVVGALHLRVLLLTVAN